MTLPDFAKFFAFSPLLIGAMVETLQIKAVAMLIEIFQSPFNRGNG